MDRSAVEDVRLRLAAIVDSSNDPIISKTLDGVITTWNLAAQQLFGYSEAEAVGQPITIIIPADLHDEEKDLLSRVRAGDRIEHYETRRVTRDGRTLDVSITISPVRDATGTIVGASKILRDITESRRARAALATIPQRLIDAQEKERRRIARELHDDIGQRLAALIIGLDLLAQASDAPATGNKRQIEEARDEVMNLAKDVQALSHRLHPSRLEYLGIAVAAAALCREVSRDCALEITFNAENVPKGVSRRIGVCLYRVLQEALQNAIKYSGMQKIDVILRGAIDQIELTVRDLGAGFEVSTTQGRGLGLTSMQERVRAVRGQLSILSEPHHGTTIRATVPLVQDVPASPPARRDRAGG